MSCSAISLEDQARIPRTISSKDDVRGFSHIAIVVDLRAGKMSKAADIVEQTVHEMVTYDAFPDSLAEERDEQPIRADHAGDPTADLDCWRIP